MTHRDLCILVARYFIDQPWCSLTGWEITYNRGFADVIAISLKDKGLTQRICVAEVKRTRADLLCDLKKQKMLKYEKGSTHCYLAATPEALRLNKITEKECLEELTKLGLPNLWGVLVIGAPIRCIRSPRKINDFNILRNRALTKSIARSHMYRILNDNRSTISDTEEAHRRNGSD